MIRHIFKCEEFDNLASALLTFLGPSYVLLAKSSIFGKMKGDDLAIVTLKK